jgi:hypothetical protein
MTEVLPEAVDLGSRGLTLELIGVRGAAGAGLEIHELCRSDG